MKKVLIGLSTGILFVAFTVCAQAPLPPPRGTGSGHPDMGMELEHPVFVDPARLTIDENRMEAIREIEVRAVKEGIRKRAELQIAAIELREILAKDPVDIKVAEAKLKQIASVRADIQLSHIKTVEEIKSKLTKEERKKFKEFLESAHMGFEGRHDPDKPFPPVKGTEDKRTAPPRAKKN
ncbi:MAG: periplasmic heavy metal sensor [Syntrophorhabdaceae bacterium]|nr:periplasmic heavy metal sensor [Syntrophorhabdaceae bacterium]